MEMVSTQNGSLRGERNDTFEVFRGIPYAAPPIGPLRWRPPEPPLDWKGVRDATTFGPACCQKAARQSPERDLADGAQSEDCLTLNIWRPVNATASLPVMVWVHGGSFRFGAGSLSVYDGSELAKRGAIVVTLNYRLGLFGTFAHPALRQPGAPDGNYGLLDVMAALRWVQDNIAAFGGDPRAVTLFGESAGGVSVAYLMASPLARGLFQRAIIQSGGLHLPEYSRPHAEEIARRTGEALGARTADALRALPASAIRNAVTAPADTMPFIDGTIVRESARAAFAAGRVQHVPLLIGYNDAEAGFFGPSYWQSLPQQIGEDAWHALRTRCFGYGAMDDDACAEQVASELFAGVNTRAFARGASSSSPVYAYRFAWVPPLQRDSTRGAIHTAEIPYVFGLVPLWDTVDVSSRKLSQLLADQWVAFAKTGEPDDVANWPRFEKEMGEQWWLIGPDAETVGPNPAAELLDAIDALRLPPRP